MSDETTRAQYAPENNSSTRIVSSFDDADGAPLGPREAFLIAYDRLALLARVARTPSVVVVAVAPDARVVDSVVVGDRRALVLGRHTRCGLRLSASTISLRHAAALVRFEGERSVVHLRDLATSRPFVTSDGEPSSAVVAEGPFYAAVGAYALWFVPWKGIDGAGWPVGAEAAAAALEAPRFVDRRKPEEASKSKPPRVSSSPPAPHATGSVVTHLAPPLLLGDGDAPEVEWGTLELRDAVRKERRAISAERLERGVLLGRYDRCGVLVDAPDNTISRVHALLLRIGSEVWIVDTASTNGVRRGETSLRAAVLADADRLSLGGVITLEWQRAIHPEA